MDKIAAGPKCKGKIFLDASVTENLKAAAKALDKSVGDITVVVLDRPRHKEIIEEARACGARIKLISDGDVAPAVSCGFPESGIDMMIGTGGAPEGVLAAAALKAIGGEFQGRLHPMKDGELERAAKMAGKDPLRLLTIDDLVQTQDVMFAATGVTDGELLNGVRFFGHNMASTKTIILRGSSGTVRFIESRHHLDRKGEKTWKLFAPIA